MNKFFCRASLFAGVAIATATLGCSGDPGEEMVKMMEQYAEVLDSNKGDCDKLATEVEKFAKENEAKFKEIEKAAKEAEKDEAKKKEFEEKYKDRMEKVMGKMMSEEVMKCVASNPKVGEAMQNFGSSK